MSARLISFMIVAGFCLPVFADPPSAGDKSTATTPEPKSDPSAGGAASGTPNGSPAPSVAPGPLGGASRQRSESAAMREAVGTLDGEANDPMVIREPSQGRPIFIEPEAEFYFVMRVLPKLVQGDVTFTLVHSREPSVRVPLWATTPPSYVNNEFASLVLKVPAGTATGLYDLEVRSAQAAYRSRHSVKVLDKFKTKFRFVQLSNMNVGDLTAPAFDDSLATEVNVLAPEFIVATGDFTEWARARNDATSWGRVLDYLAKFDAPVFAVCGSHDHEDSFTQYMANGPIGTVDYGNYHGLLLLDHPGHPIDQDFDQLRWIDADLQKNRNRTFNFLVMHSDEMGLLDAWRERGKLAEFLDRHRIRLLIAGGSTDWDFTEFKDKLEGLKNFQFVRTHESSPCLRDRATGTSHYRVFEVDGENVRFTYPDDVATEKLQYSIPAGRLRLFTDGPNDGSEERVVGTIQNGLNQPFTGAQVWLRVAKTAGQSSQPSVAGGRLAQALDAGHYWACRIETDVPDKGAVRIMASSAPNAMQAELPITAELEGPSELSFQSKQTKFGLQYFTCNSAVQLTLRNTSASAVTCWPIVRLNGSQLRIDPKKSPRIPVTLDPGATVQLPLVMNLRRLSEGPHLLQVNFLEDGLARGRTFPLVLKGSEPGEARAEASKSAGDSAARQVVGR